MIHVAPFLLWSISLLCLRILVGLDDDLSRACSSALSHSIDAGMGVDSVLSCEDDVGGDESDELDEEDVVDKSGDRDRNVVFCITLYVNTVFNETWSSIIGPLTCISVILAKLSEQQHCCRIFEDFQCQEYIQFFDVN